MGASVCIWEPPFGNGTWRGIFSLGLKKNVPFTNGTGFHLQTGGSHLQMGAIRKREVTGACVEKPEEIISHGKKGTICPSDRLPAHEKGYVCPLIPDYVFFHDNKTRQF